MKEDLAAIERLEEPVACLGEKLCHTGMRKVFVSFDEPAAAVDELLDLPLHLFEGILDHEGEIARGEGPGVFAFDHQFRPGHLEVDADLKEVTLLVVTVGLVDDHATACDPVMSVLQAVGCFLDGALDDLGMGKIVERDLEWSLHGRSLVGDDRDGVNLPPRLGRSRSRPEQSKTEQPARAPDVGEKQEHHVRGGSGRHGPITRESWPPARPAAAPGTLTTRMCPMRLCRTRGPLDEAGSLSLRCSRFHVDTPTFQYSRIGDDGSRSDRSG